MDAVEPAVLRKRKRGNAISDSMRVDLLITHMTGLSHDTGTQKSQGKNNLHEADGGTKVVVSGVDFWANGMPPRKFIILGVVTSEIGAGYGDADIIRSAVASETRQKGGDAAIQINENTSFSGIVRLTPQMYMATNTKTMRFAVVKYVQ